MQYILIDSYSYKQKFLGSSIIFKIVMGFWQQKFKNHCLSLLGPSPSCSTCLSNLISCLLPSLISPSFLNCSHFSQCLMSPRQTVPLISMVLLNAVSATLMCQVPAHSLKTKLRKNVLITLEVSSGPLLRAPVAWRRAMTLRNHFVWGCLHICLSLYASGSSGRGRHFSPYTHKL